MRTGTCGHLAHIKNPIPTPAAPAPRSQLTLSRRALVLLLVALLAPWLLTGTLALRQRTAGSAAPADAAPHEASGRALNSGPWGRITTIDVNLETPEEFIPLELSSTCTTTWHFAGMDEAAVESVLRSSDLPDAQRRRLEDRARWRATPAGIDLLPPDDVLLAMPSEARERIYASLASLPGNGPQRNPYTFMPDQVDARFARAGLAPATLEMLKGLLYRRGAVLLLSDTYAAVNAVTSRTEKLAVARAISRKPALLLNLRVDASSDIDALAAYWGKGGRARSLRPLLAALAREPGGGEIDVVNLLPDFARRRLNVFPTPDQTAAVREQDCYWSAFNFFAEGDFFLPSSASATNDPLQRDYFQVSGTPTFGDLLFLVLPTGESLHAMTYVADGIVFTKNGGAEDQPWIFMRMDDVAMGYSAARVRQEPVSVLAWRRRDL